MNVAFIVQTVFLINNVKSKIPSNENNTYRLATKFFIFLGNYRPCSVVLFENNFTNYHICNNFYMGI